MRKLGVLAAAAALVAAACVESPTDAVDPNFDLSMRPVVVHHSVNMINAIESPACPSRGKGIANVKIHDDGSISSSVAITNRGGESVRFGHIHHLNTGAATGPVIWWLSSPIGTDLNLTAADIRIAQLGAFVTNAHFTSNAAGIAELLAKPQDFYVNFHSDNCPGGFARAFLGHAENGTSGE